MKEEKLWTLWHQSGVNKNGEPFVQLMKDTECIGQFTPEECRSHARGITEAAEAAEQDAFFVQYFKQKMELEDHVVFGFLLDFRRWREERGKKGPPSDPREFMRTPKHK